MRKRTGNRNRYRPRGRSSYARQGKSRSADFYGEWINGRCIVPEKIRK